MRSNVALCSLVKVLGGNPVLQIGMFCAERCPDQLLALEALFFGRESNHRGTPACS